MRVKARVFGLGTGLSLLVAGIALSGCFADGGEPGGPAGDDPAVLDATEPEGSEAAVEDDVGDEKADAVNIPFEYVKFEVPASVGNEPTRKVFKSAKAFQAYFGVPAPAGIDFSKEWVVFYSAGWKPTTGYGVEIVKIRSSLGMLKITTRLSSPGPDCMLAEVLMKPYLLARFARPASVVKTKFYKNDTTHGCEKPGGEPLVCGGIAGFQCPKGYVCVDAPDGCDPAKGDADCIGTCVPDSTPGKPFACGGIANLPCPDGYTCVDAPDYCDPAKGHADCIGVCVKPEELCGGAVCQPGWTCVNCFGGPVCLPPGSMCAF